MLQDAKKKRDANDIKMLVFFICLFLYFLYSINLLFTNCFRVTY